MPSRSEVRQLRDALAGASALAARELRAFWSALDKTDMVAARVELEAFYPALVRAYGTPAAAAAAEWIEDVYGIRAELGPDLVEGAVNARMRWAIGKSFEGDHAQALSTLTVLTDELVKQPGRDTIDRTAIRHRMRYARVPTGPEPCAWCLMLASRGAVYGSEESALYRSSDGKEYHGDCNCMPTLIRTESDLPDGYDPDALKQTYDAARKYAFSDAPEMTQFRDSLDPGDKNRDAKLISFAMRRKFPHLVSDGIHPAT